MKTSNRRILTLLLALCLLFGQTGSAFAADTAATMQLSKTEGTVTVCNASAKGLTILENMRLYNGYTVETGASSYAWINLDSSKLIKLDASTKVEIRKSGSKLEVLLKSGNLVADVSKKLESSETLNVRTSTAIVGIRGTIVEVDTTYIEPQTGETAAGGSLSDLQQKTTVVMIEGVTSVTTTSSDGAGKATVTTTTASAGETLTVTPVGTDEGGDTPLTEVSKTALTTEDVSGFTQEHLTEGGKTTTIETADGPVTVTPETAAERNRQDQAKAAETAAANAAGAANQVQNQNTAGANEKTADNVWTGNTDSGSNSNPGNFDDNSGFSFTPTSPALPSESGAASEPDSPSEPNVPSEPDVPSVTNCTVTFDSQGGSAAASQTIDYGGIITQPTDPARAGYTFEGWYTSNSFDTKYDFSLAVTGNLTLYANWVPKKYAVTLNTNGGTINSGNVTEYTYDQVTALPTDVVRDGDTFGGWYDNERLTGTPVTAITETDTGDKAFWAKWNPPLWMWELNENNDILRIYGTGDMDSFIATVQPWKDSAAAITTVVIEDGVTGIGDYAFSGCVRLAAVTIPDSVTSIGNNVFQDCNNLKDIHYTGTREAWDLLNYTPPNGVIVHCTDDVAVTYDLNYAGAPEPSTTTIYYTSAYLGEKIPAPARPDDRTDGAYEFGGWYEDQTCTLLWDFDNRTLKGEMTLYAKWIGESETLVLAGSAGNNADRMKALLDSTVCKEIKIVKGYQADDDNSIGLDPCELKDKTVTLGEGAALYGKVTSSGTLVVDGVVEGSIVSSGTLTVNGTVRGGVTAEGDLTIDGGTVAGGVTVTGMGTLIMESGTILPGTADAALTLNAMGGSPSAAINGGRVDGEDKITLKLALNGSYTANVTVNDPESLAANKLPKVLEVSDSSGVWEVNMGGAIFDMNSPTECYMGNITSDGKFYLSSTNYLSNAFNGSGATPYCALLRDNSTASILFTNEYPGSVLTLDLNGHTFVPTNITLSTGSIIITDTAASKGKFTVDALTVGTFTIKTADTSLVDITAVNTQYKFSDTPDADGYFVLTEVSAP